MPSDWSDPSELLVTLDEPRNFNRVVIQEQIGDYSQRIERFRIDAYEKGQWRNIAEGTTVGYKRICRTPTVTTDRVRLRVLSSRIAPTISEFGLYLESSQVDSAHRSRPKR
jgi:alpha-L-fucosidase